MTKSENSDPFLPSVLPPPTTMYASIAKSHATNETDIIHREAQVFHGTNVMGSFLSPYKFLAFFLEPFFIFK